MPVLPKRSLGAAGADDKVDCRARNHALQVGASGRRTVGALIVAWWILVVRSTRPIPAAGATLEPFRIVETPPG